jgi:hypothetical protein
MNDHHKKGPPPKLYTHRIKTPKFHMDYSGLHLVDALARTEKSGLQQKGSNMDSRSLRDDHHGMGPSLNRVLTT